MFLATASRSESLRRVLKALAKSNFTRTQSVGIDVVCDPAAGCMYCCFGTSWYANPQLDRGEKGGQFGNSMGVRTFGCQTSQRVSNSDWSDSSVSLLQSNEIGTVDDFVDLDRQ